MKPIYRKVIAVISVIFLLGIISSCRHGHQTADSSLPNAEQATNEVNTNKEKFAREFKDSIIALRKNLAVLSDKLEETNGNLEKLTSDVELLSKREPGGNQHIYIIFFVGIVVLLFVLFVMIKIKKPSFLFASANKSLTDKKIDLPQESKGKDQLITPPSLGSVEREKIEELAKKLAKIEKKLSALDSCNSVEKSTCNRNPSSSVSQKKYFGVPIKGEAGRGYFKNLLDNREEARFSATIFDTEAKYSPMIPHTSIIASDAMDLALEFRGVSKGESKTFTVEEEGVAHLVENKWIISKRAVIILK